MTAASRSGSRDAGRGRGRRGCAVTGRRPRGRRAGRHGRQGCGIGDGSGCRRGRHQRRLAGAWGLSVGCGVGTAIGGEAAICGSGVAALHEVGAVLVRVLARPAGPPGSRSIVCPAAGAAVVVPSSQVLVALPQPTARWRRPLPGSGSPRCRRSRPGHRCTSRRPCARDPPAPFAISAWPPAAVRGAGRPRRLAGDGAARGGDIDAPPGLRAAGPSPTGCTSRSTHPRRWRRRSSPH